MNMPGTLAGATNLIHERKQASTEDPLSQRARSLDHPEHSNRATVPVPLRRLAASQTTRPENAGQSGLRRGMGTFAKRIR